MWLLHITCYFSWKYCSALLKRVICFTNHYITFWLLHKTSWKLTHNYQLTVWSDPHTNTSQWRHAVFSFTYEHKETSNPSAQWFYCTTTSITAHHCYLLKFRLWLWRAYLQLFTSFVLACCLCRCLRRAGVAVVHSIMQLLFPWTFMLPHMN